VDVLVIGAGMVGAACAYYCAEAGLSVGVVERGAVASGTTSGGEGNILVSDKEPGVELDLALLSARLWASLGERFGADRFELQAKGGVVVARSSPAAAGLTALAARQRACGVDAIDVSPAELAALEPNLTRDVACGVHYPQDMQVQPMLAAAELLRQARSLGATVHTGTSVDGVVKGRGVIRVRTSAGEMSARWVVNAAGTWGGEIAALARAAVPILPRRGFVLVTEPLPTVVRHKVYSADYVANVASADAGLETSVVVEGTRAGSVLIGASRERVGFDRRVSLAVLRRLAAAAVGLFPFLAQVNLMRSYLGFRPYCPDHLPVIGLDPRVPGLVHACGHEGAGIGLSAATGHLIAQTLTGVTPDLDLAPFRPDRFTREVVG
jgi:glycine/D-amino acid oxidase-like deaminating enzyme